MTVPGPRGLPLLGDVLAFRADRLAFLTRLARDHGDVATFRIGPYRVWQLAHPEQVRDVLVANAARFRKGPVLQRARLVLGDGLLTAEGDQHRRDRRLLQPAFSSRRVAGYADAMVDRAERAARSWEPDVPFDLHAATVRITLASAGATLLGTEVEDDVDLVASAIEDLLSAYKLAFVPFGWRLQRLPLGPMRRLQRGRASLHRLVDRMIERRRREAVDGGDLLSALVVGETSGDLDPHELRDQVVTLLLAGHETTANALAFAFHLLATHPEAESQVHAELERVLGDRLPTAEDVAELSSCRALFAESLRLYPPSWAMGRQAIADHPVGGHVVAAGELALLPQWVVHRDPRWWPEPDRCRLDRWEGTPAPRPRGAYFPFGAGSRQCIGEGFAWTEGILAIATIARRWRLRPVAGRPVTLDPLITLRPAAGVWMRPIRRSTAG
jgi:cytochrome P450